MHPAGEAGTGQPGHPDGFSGRLDTAGSPPPAAAPSYSSDVHDPLSPRQPDTRPSVACCIIQRGAAINDAEEALRYSLTALVADASLEVLSSDAVRAIGNIQGVEEGSFSVIQGEERKEKGGGAHRGKIVFSHGS